MQLSAVIIGGEIRELGNVKHGFKDISVDSLLLDNALNLPSDKAI